MNTEVKLDVSANNEFETQCCTKYIYSYIFNAYTQPFGINLAYDPAADGENTKGVKGKLTNSTTAATHVNAKNFGVVNAVAKLGADIVCTKDLMFSLNATIGVTNKGDQRSYGGGFKWQF